MKGRKIMMIVLTIAAVLVAVCFVGWLGLRVQPAPFPAFGQGQPEQIRTVPLAEGLPKPVERFYRLVYGERVPVIESAVLTGRATIRPMGPVEFPARYRFTHEAGKGYRHYIEACWFGIPVMKVDESYLEGKSHIEIPFVGEDSGPNIDWSANQGMWAESWQFPALFVTDPRVRWQAIDDETAVLVVPFERSVQRFVVRFDPETGMPTWTETMRFRTSSSTEKTLWMTFADHYRKVDGVLINTAGSATWMDDGRPWATFRLEDIRLNVDVSGYLRQKGI